MRLPLTTAFRPHLQNSVGKPLFSFLRRHVRAVAADAACAKQALVLGQQEAKRRIADQRLDARPVPAIGLPLDGCLRIGGGLTRPDRLGLYSPMLRKLRPTSSRAHGGTYLSHDFATCACAYVQRSRVRTRSIHARQEAQGGAPAGYCANGNARAAPAARGALVNHLWSHEAVARATRTGEED